jgi:methyl-accepting chemotaxis protein
MLDTQPTASVVESEAERRRRFLRLLTWVYLSFASVSIILIAILQLVKPSPPNLITLVLLILSFFVVGTANILSRSLKTVKLGSWLFVLFMLALPDARLLISGSNVPSAGLFISAIIITMFLMPVKGIWISLPWSLFSVIFYLIIESIGYIPPSSSSKQEIGPVVVIFNWCLVIVLATVLVFYLFSQLRKALRSAAEQNARLVKSLEIIENKQRLAEEAGQRISSATAELNATSAQQNANSQRQAVAIEQVANFVQEISEAAKLIAGKAQHLNSAAHDIKEATQSVKEATLMVATAGEEGEQAVERTVVRNQQVTSLYEQLRNLLNELDQRQNQIREVVYLIKSIGDETHLLSLNAAIEAAGAGEYGERFGVVAHEIKALASRSLTSSNDAREKLGEIEKGIRQAAVAAEEGYRQTQEALGEAESSGEALRNLADKIERNVLEVEKIEMATRLMGLETDEIRVATEQQSPAARQATESLREIETLAKQTVIGSTEMTQSTHLLEELSHDLRKSLVYNQ